MSLNDVSDAFEDWLEPLTATRTPGTYVNYRWVPGTPETISFYGVVQNATPADLMVLAEGNRTEEAIKVHTTTKLIALVEGTNGGDVVSYNNFNWLIYNISDRKIGNYYKAIAIKQQ